MPSRSRQQGQPFAVGWRFDREVWFLARRKYSAAYICDKLGCTPYRLKSALTRIQCGRYGHPPDFSGLS